MRARERRRGKVGTERKCIFHDVHVYVMMIMGEVVGFRVRFHT